jgi:hypothetical protein
MNGNQPAQPVEGNENSAHRQRPHATAEGNATPQACVAARAGHRESDHRHMPNADLWYNDVQPMVGVQDGTWRQPFHVKRAQGGRHHVSRETTAREQHTRPHAETAH